MEEIELLMFPFSLILIICYAGIDWLLPGRFDFHVQLPAPAASERQAILRHEIRRRSLQCSENILLDVASKCDGYDAYDLVLVFTSDSNYNDFFFFEFP